MSRILGIDYGEKRIGLALSDPTGTVATPWKVIDASPASRAREDIVNAVEKERVDCILIGLPMRLDGSSGPAAEAARAFGTRLAEHTSVPVIYWDERMSTVTAQQALIEGGARRSKRKQVVDKLAAQIILQHYLDAQAGLPPMPSFQGS